MLTKMTLPFPSQSDHIYILEQDAGENIYLLLRKIWYLQPEYNITNIRRVLIEQVLKVSFKKIEQDQ